MRNKFLFILIIFFWFNFLVNAESDCEKLSTNYQFQQYQLAFKHFSKTRPLWDQFKFSNRPILIISPDIKKCLAVLSSDSDTRFFPFDTDSILKDSWRTISIEPNSYPPATEEEQYILSEYSLSRMLVIRLHQYLPYVFDLSAHESFHAFYQTDDRTPIWVRHADRSVIANKCYFLNNSQYKQEAELLITSLDMISMGHLDIAKNILRYFLQARKKRYLDLSGVTINTNDGFQMLTCEEAETNMELVEGHAQFYGESVNLNMGLTTYYTLLSKYRYSLNDTETGWQEPFYGFGSLQLHIIKAFKGKHFIEWTQGLYNNPSRLQATLCKEIEQIVTSDN